MPVASLPLGCPPNDAMPCTSVMYRLVAAPQIAPTDFISHFELYPSRSFPDECIARGLSVFLSFEAACKLRKRFRAYSQFRIAVASFPEAVGVIKQTGSCHHHTWWPEEGTDPSPAFQIDPADAQ